jgi:hypothetical protein
MLLTKMCSYAKGSGDMNSNIVLNKGKRERITARRYNEIELGSSTASCSIPIRTPKGEKYILRVNKDFKPFVNKN